MAAGTQARAAVIAARRLDGFTVAVVALTTVVLVVGAIAAVVSLRVLGGAACQPPPRGDCGSDPAFSALADDIGGRLSFAIGVAPLAFGVLLGAPLLARELERGTAALAWSMSGSRLGWLLWRLLPIGVPLVLALGALAVAGESLTAARFPLLDPGRTFFDYASRGPLLAVRGVTIFVVALLLGLLTRRMLAALLLSAAVAFSVAAVSDVTRTMGVPWVELDSPAACSMSCVQLTEAYRTADGELLFPSEVRSLAAADGVRGGPASDEFREWLDGRALTQVTIAITGDAYGGVALRESLVLLIVTGVTAGLIILTLDRTRVE
jgi:hypothetical protein